MATGQEAERSERLFIAVPLQENARDALRRVLKAPLPGKPIPPHNWHFTLRFLGATSTSTRDALISALSSNALGRRFTIHFNQLGAFPNPRRARILWAGIDRGAERMIELAAIAESVARATGFAAESRRFTPHLTIARIDPPTALGAVISGTTLDISMVVDRVTLYRSHLGKGPAQYEQVASFGL